MGKKLFDDKFIGYHTFGLEVDGVIVNSVNNNGFNYVDLGLPSGTLWATDDLRKTGFSIGLTIKYCLWGSPGSPTVRDTSGMPSNIPNYNNVIVSPALSTSGYVSQNIDVIHNDMGGDWVTPSLELFIELDEYCTSTYDSSNHKITFTGPNGNSITFLTHGGYILGNLVGGSPTSKHYLWTSSTDSESANNMHAVAIIESSGIGIGKNTFNDYLGMNLRGVINGKYTVSESGKGTK